MYTNARFQSIGKTSDFGTKFTQNYIKDKNFEKINMKIVISISLYTPAPNFSQSGKLQIFRPNFTKKI